MSKKSAEAFPLCHHLDGLVDELRQYVPAAIQEFDTQAIHKARVTTRRLKAAMALLASVLDETHAKPFGRLGKKLRRRLGPMRDADVMLGHLEEIKPDSRLAPAAEWLRQELLHDREVARARSVQKTPAGDVISRLGRWWALRQQLIESNPDVATLLADSVQVQLSQFAEQAERAGQGHDPHQLRIAGKLLRYTLEMAEKGGHKLPANVLKIFKRMQDLLGLWHDHVVMVERIMQGCIEKHLALHDGPMQLLVLQLAEHAIAKSELELRRFDKLWTEKGEELARTIRKSFKLESPVKPPQTDHGPVGSATPPAPDIASTAPPSAA